MYYVHLQGLSSTNSISVSIPRMSSHGPCFNQTMSPSSPNHHNNIRTITNGVSNSNSPSPTSVSSTTGIPVGTAVAAATTLSVNPVSLFSARSVAAVPVMTPLTPVITTSVVTPGTVVAAVAASPSSSSSNSVFSMLGNIAHPQPINNHSQASSSLSSLIPSGVNASKALEMFMVTAAQTPLPIIALSGGAAGNISNSRTITGNVSCAFTPTTTCVLQNDSFINNSTRIRPSTDVGPNNVTTRVTTLERRENNTHHAFEQILSHNTYR